MSSPEHAARKVLRIAGGIVVALAFYVPLLLLGILPHRPRGFVGWLILVGVGVPIALVLEVLSGSVLTEQRGRGISAARFSVRRILFAMAFAVVVFGALSWIG